MAVEPLSPSNTASQYFSTSGRRTDSSRRSIHVNVRMTEDLVARLGKVGDEEGLSMSDTIRLVLERGLAHRKKDHSQ